MNEKIDKRYEKGFFKQHELNDKFHLGICFGYDKLWNEIHIFLCVGHHDFLLEYRW